MEDRLPISDNECEEIVLGTIISTQNSFEQVGDILDEDCFSTQRNKDIFRSIKTILRRGDSPDLITLRAEMEKTTSKMSVSDIIEVYEKKTFELGQHSLRLKELSIRRKMYELSYYLLQNGTSEINDLQEVIEKLRKELENLYSGVKDNIKDALSYATEVYNQIKSNMETNNSMGTPTGFHQIDEKGGLLPSDLVLIAAESSQGKTSLAGSITVFAAKSGAKIAFYSLEMTGRQLMNRFASMESGIPAMRIRNEKLDDWEFDKVGIALGELARLNIFFDERSTSSIDSIITSIRSLKLKKNIDGVVIDYLQILTIGKREREEQLAEAARRLKNLAKELDIWIIALSQLNRDRGKDKDNPEPTVSRLRGSGQINEAADMTILIYRPEYYKKSYSGEFVNVNTQGTALIDVAKGRNVGPFKFIVGFDKNTTKFYELANVPQGVQSYDDNPF